VVNFKFLLRATTQSPKALANIFKNILKMDNIKILDEVLKYLIITEFRTFAEMRNDANEKSDFLKDIDNFIFKSALLKLVKDGYVIEYSENKIDEIFNTPRTNYYYDISFEGIIFINAGGYENEYQKNQMQKIEYFELKKKQSLLEEKQLKTQFQLVLLTLIVALGTLIAGLYYILEILAFFGVLTSQKN
jgi:hypothetical protein